MISHLILATTGDPHCGQCLSFRLRSLYSFGWSEGGGLPYHNLWIRHINHDTVDEICRPYGDIEGMGLDNAGDDGRMCRHTPYASKDTQTGSVTLKCIYLDYIRDQKNHPAVEPFSPFGPLTCFSPYPRTFFFLDRILYTLYDNDAPFQLSTKQGYDTKRGKRGRRGTLWINCLLCFERMKLKQTERVIEFE